MTSNYPILADNIFEIMASELWKNHTYCNNILRMIIILEDMTGKFTGIYSPGYFPECLKHNKILQGERIYIYLKDGIIHNKEGPAIIRYLENGIIGEKIFMIDGIICPPIDRCNPNIIYPSRILFNSDGSK